MGLEAAYPFCRQGWSFLRLRGRCTTESPCTQASSGIGDRTSGRGESHCLPQPASCLLLSIPQKGSIPRAQSPLNCPQPDAFTNSAASLASQEVMRNPRQMPCDGGGDISEKCWSTAEWHFPELSCPFSQAPETGEESDQAQEVPGIAQGQICAVAP